MSFERLDQINELVAHVEAIQDNDEEAHREEDKLREGALQSIASGAFTMEECAELAAAALRTSRLRFSRWCA